MRPFARAGLLGLAGFGLAALLVGTPADAKSTFDSAYGYERTWNAALRLVRVDMGLKVTEKDDANGYLLFEYKGTDTGKHPSNGSFEFVRSREPDAPVRVVVQLSQMPRFHEQMLLDALARKMRLEYGDPPPRKPTPPSHSDAGADAGESPP